VSRLVALLALGLGVLVVVVLLRQETMSVHTLGAPGSSTVVVVEASARPQRSTTRVAALARAQIALCRTEVHDETREPDVVHSLPWTFTFRLRPALDESDRRQLHGCLEDARVDHLQLQVVSMEDGDGDGDGDGGPGGGEARRPAPGP
jgi:hypothetical protein